MMIIHLVAGLLASVTSYIHFSSHSGAGNLHLSWKCLVRHHDYTSSDNLLMLPVVYSFDRIKSDLLSTFLA